MDYHHQYNFYFAKSGREEVFKIGQVVDEELLSLSQKIVINWIWFGMISDSTYLTLNEIDEANGEKSVEMYYLLGKWKDWPECKARYRALAEVVEIAFSSMRDLVETYCHDKGK